MRRTTIILTDTKSAIIGTRFAIFVSLALTISANRTGSAKQKRNFVYTLFTPDISATSRIFFTDTLNNIFIVTRRSHMCITTLFLTETPTAILMTGLAGFIVVTNSVTTGITGAATKQFNTFNTLIAPCDITTI